MCAINWEFIRSVPRHGLLKEMLVKLYAEKQTD
jgi:hypothetical protein